MAGPPRFKRIVGFGLLVLVACHFALNLQEFGLVYLNTDAYTHFRAKLPYQTRVLMAPVLAGLIEFLSLDGPSKVLNRMPAYISQPEGAAYLCINVVAFTVSCRLMLEIARISFRSPVAMRLALAVYIALLYLFLCLNPGVPFILPYDLPALALSQACLLTILTGRFVWLYPLFALATLNRETSFLVILFMVFQALTSGRPHGRLWVHVACLSGLWLAVKVGLHFRFADLPSDEGLRVAFNLRTLIKPWQWPTLLPPLACFVLSLQSLRLNSSQREWAITGCVGFVMISFVGVIVETRAFADLLTYFAIAITQRVLQMAASWRDNQSTGTVPARRDGW